MALLISFVLGAETKENDTSPIDPRKLKKEQEEEQLGQKQNFFDLNEENFADTLLEFLDTPDKVLPLMVHMVTGECTVGACVEFSKVINIVAGITKRQNRIAHISCGMVGKVCHDLPNHEAVNGIMSIYMRNGKVYEFDGNQTKEGLLDFLSADNWMDAPVIEGNLDGYIQNVLDFDIGWYGWGMKKVGQFAEGAETFVKKKYKKVPYVDRWSVNAKILLTAFTIIPPFTFIFIYCVSLMYVTYYNYCVDKKYEKLNSEMDLAKKDN